MKRITVFRSTKEEEEAKWKQMANSTVDERMAIMIQLQRIAYPDTFDALTGKRKPLEHRITIKKYSPK